MIKPMCCGFSEPCETCQRVREFAVKEIKDLEIQIKRVVRGKGYNLPGVLQHLGSRRDALEHVLEKMPPLQEGFLYGGGPCGGEVIDSEAKE